MLKNKTVGRYVKSIQKTFENKTTNDESSKLTEHATSVDIKSYDSAKLIGSKWLWTGHESGRSLGHSTSEGVESRSDPDVSREARLTLMNSTATSQVEQKLPKSVSNSNNGARPKTELTSKTPQRTVNTAAQVSLKRTKSLNVIEEEANDDDREFEERLPLCENDQTSDYDTMHREDISDDESGDEDYRTHCTATRAISCSVPDLRSKGKQDAEMRDLRPLQKNYIVKVKTSKNVQITQGKGTATMNRTSSVSSNWESRHLTVLENVRKTTSKVETELFKGGQKVLDRLAMVIFKGSEYGCDFAAKMLFERVVSASKDDIKAYYLKHPDEMSNVDHEEKAVILVVDLNGPTGADRGRLDGWYEVLKERMATGTCTRGNLTFIMTLKDSDLDKGRKHPLLEKYGEYIVDAAKKELRPSSSTKEKLVEAFMRQKHLRVNPVKGGTPNLANKDGNFTLIDKGIVDGIIPLLGSVRCIGKLAAFFRTDLSEGLNSLRKPVPDIVQRIRESYEEGGKLFLTLLAVHAHGGHLGVGRLNQMRKLNEQTEKFWYSTDNIDKLSKRESRKIEKLLQVRSLELKHLYSFAFENNHLMNLGNKLQIYARCLDGEFLAEKNDVYRFCDGRVYYSFLLVYCEVYPDALENCEDNFFFNFVQSSRNTFESDTDALLKVDDRKLNIRTRAVMKRFKKEMMLRHIAKCMKHPIMSMSFFQLFLRYLGETKHLLWKVLTKLDCDPKEPYSCLYHGMTEEQDTFKGIPRNITEVIILHDIWKKKRKKPTWNKWTTSQEAESLIRAAELSNCQTFTLMYKRGAKIPIAALMKAIDVGAEEIVEFISNNAVFSQHEWCAAAQYAAKSISDKTPTQTLLQCLMSLVTKTDVNTGIEDIPPLIHHAVQINDATLLRKLVEGDLGATAVDINKVYRNETPLTAATRLGFQDIVAILLEKNAKQSRNEIFIASTKGDNEILRLLLHKTHALILAEDSKGLIPIFYAVTHGHCETVATLLSEAELFRNDSTCESLSTDLRQPKMVVNAAKASTLLSIRQCQKTNRERKTALHIAAEMGNTGIISLLLSNGFDVNATDRNNETPLSLACKGRHIQAIRVILNTWNSKGHKTDERVVMCVVQNGDIEVMELLVEYGFDINFVNKQFGIPLHVAIQYGMHEMVRLLLLKGADPDISQDDYRSLHVAAGKGDIESLKLLKEFGVDVTEVTSAKRESIVHLATEKKHTHFIETLFQMLDCSRLIDMKNANGETALHVACKLGCPVLITLLLENGFNSKLTCRNGCIPVVLAEQGLQRSIKSKNSKKWNAFADCVKILKTWSGK